MLIFQLHVITNSMQALCALSHSQITFRKAPFPYKHVSLKYHQLIGQSIQKLICPVLPDGKTDEKYFHLTNLLH